MFANDIFNIIDKLVPRKYALENDRVGYFGKTFDNLDIKNIKILMDLFPDDDLKFSTGDLVISHHPPLFMPKTPTYVVHSNWDIVNGGSNDSLAYYLGLKPISIFHKQSGIGRICSSTKTLDQFLALVCYKFGPENVRLVHDGDFDGVTLIDISHHIIELPGLFALTELLRRNEEIDVPVEMIDTGVPWKYISADF